MTTNRRLRCLPFLHSALVVTLSFSITASAQTGGWFKAGDHPNDYDMGTDNRAFTGGSSGYIRNNKPDPQGFGTYMQMFEAGEYRGKRVRLSAYIQSENVENWAGLWMRVDRERTPTAFDNMQDRPIKGTHDWTHHAVVLDIDSNATAIAFGILLRGNGAVWIDDVTFEVVGEDVPVTDLQKRTPGAPRNLDFENGPAPKPRL